MSIPSMEIDTSSTSIANLRELCIQPSDEQPTDDALQNFLAQLPDFPDTCEMANVLAHLTGRIFFAAHMHVWSKYGIPASNRCCCDNDHTIYMIDH